MGTKKKRVANPGSVRSDAGALAVYLSDIIQIPLITVDEEQRLARKLRDEGDVDAAHALVTGNLRFVVKIVFEYRSYGFRMVDLIQEGNIGLMKAVQKFDPDRRIRLLSYGVWWIRAYIQNYILRNWSQVKLGTTQAQRKLFFSLARTKRELEKTDGQPPDDERLATRLKVKAAEVAEMRQRLDGRDLSLDAPLGDAGHETHLDQVPQDGPSAEELYAHAVQSRQVRFHVVAALEKLDARERFIVEHRVMSDRPMTLNQLGAHFGFSRERARQLEIRAKQKLHRELAGLAALINAD